MPELDNNAATETSNASTESIYDDISEWMTDIDESSGDFQFKLPPRSPNADSQVMDRQSQTVTETEDTPTTPPTDVYADRFGKIENTVQQLINVVVGMGQMLQNQGQNSNYLNSLQQQEPEYDLEDKNDLAKFIVDTVQRSVQTSVQPLMQMMPQLSARISYQDAIAQYGNEFTGSLDAIKTVMESGANINFDQAFKIVQAVKGKVNGSAGSHSTKQIPKQKPQGSPQDLIAKSQRLQTAEGVTNPARETREVKSVRDAFFSALEELSQRGE